MKKYNMSKIMRRAWALVKKMGMTISDGLKKAWKEAKTIVEEKLKLNVIGSEIFTVNTSTGEITGKTYNAKDWIKRNFNAKWDSAKKIWVANAAELKAELAKNEKYYAKYIVSDSAATARNLENDEIINKELVNKSDGFYSKNIWKSGRVTYTFVG